MSEPMPVTTSIITHESGSTSRLKGTRKPPTSIQLSGSRCSMGASGGQPRVAWVKRRPSAPPT